MSDKLDELDLIYKMIGNYGFRTVQDLLNAYEKQKDTIDKAIEYIEENTSIQMELFDTSKLLSILGGKDGRYNNVSK